MESARNYNSFLARQVAGRAPPRSDILDFGAGIGTFAKLLSEAQHHVRCVEPDPTLRHHLAADGLSAYASLTEIRAGSLDYIYSLNVLEHIEDDLGALIELRSRLRVGGIILIYVPAFQILFSSMDRKVGHFRRYRRRRLIQLFHEAGIEPMEVRYCDSLGFFATLAFKAFGNGEGRMSETGLILYDRIFFPVSRLLDRLFCYLFGKNLLAIGRSADRRV